MRRLAIVFTGSAQDLKRRTRRAVLVNWVLGGLSTSVVRRQTARYLEERTTIDGLPLVHVPSTASRWPAILLAAGFIASRLANEFGHGPPLPVLVVAAVLLVPWVWGTATARTIDGLRWGDLSLAFTARWTEVYAASWPLLALGLAWAWVQPTVAAMAEANAADSRVVAGALIAVVVAFPLLAIQAFNFRRLRFTRTRIGDLQAEWPARLPGYLRLCALAAAGVVVTAVLPVLMLRHAWLGEVMWDGRQDATALAVYAAGFVLLVLLSSPARAWYEARLFTLTWNGLRVGDTVRVTSTLDTRAFVRMRVRDTLRTLCTFGAHHAQAVVNAYQAKLAALAVDADDAWPGPQLR